MSGLPPVLTAPLPYVERLARRVPGQIDTVILHCTELPDLATAREYGERIHYQGSQTGNSGHYYIDRDGSLHEWVEPLRQAHHCRGWNTGSIGIELVNTGRFPHWLATTHQAMDEAYSDAQIATLIALLGWLRERFPSITRIAGHEDLDRERVPADDDANVLLARKRDPGPLFPWDEVLEATGLMRLPAGAQPDFL